MTGVPSMIGGTTTGVSLQAVIDAPRRLDELSTARVIGEAAEAVHKAQKGGQPLGTLEPQAIVVAAAGISLAPPSSGAVAYSAPEKLRGQAGDRRSDVFSLGVLLWEALAHERLFDGATDDARKTAVLEREIQPPSELNANVPAELDAICKKALARDPADRFQSAKVMAAEISAVLDDAGYPDSNDEIAKYLGTAFPGGSPSAAPATASAPPAGAALAAKLAATPTGAHAPALKANLNMTTLGMAPIRETARPEPASPEPVVAKPAPASGPPEMPAPVAAAPAPVKPAAAKPEPVKPEKSGKKFKTKTGPAKTVQVGSNLSKPESATPDPAKTMPAGSSMSAADVKAEVAKLAEPARPNTPSSGLSPMAFTKPVTAPPPNATSTPVHPATTATMGSMSEPTTTSPASGPAKHPLPTPQRSPKIEPMAAPVVEPVIELVAKPEPVIDLVAKPAISPSISQAETVATPALVPTAAAPSEPMFTSPSGIVGLPAMPPGADRSFDDDFATNAGAKPFVPAPAAPVVAAPAGAAPIIPASPVLPASADGSAVDPSAAVSLPRPRSQTGGELLAGWGWSTDSHAAIDDGGGYEEEDTNKASRKRLLIAIGGALGAILLIVVIALAAGGGGDKEKPKDETTQVAPDTSRKATDPVAKPADEPPTEPATAVAVAPTEPATATAPTEPVTTVTPAVAAPAEPDPAIAEAAKAEAAKTEAAKIEAARIETARADAAKAEVAKAEAAKTAKAEALAAKAEVAKAETARIAAAKAEAKQAKEAKAEAARLAAAKTPPREQTKVAIKEPKKKDPKLKTSAPKPIDPYATEKPKVDPAAAYKTGFQQYVRGDTSGALATFKASLSASSGYPPTWRGLGLVYEKLGQKAQAKGAFRRYLQLSPNANDAEQIRTRMERL